MIRTTLPSPLPKSTNVDPLCLEACPIRNMLAICLSVAGTYGRQIFRKAGVTNGVVTRTIPTAAAPVIPRTTLPSLDLVLGFLASSCNSNPSWFSGLMSVSSFFPEDLWDCSTIHGQISTDMKTAIYCMSFQELCPHKSFHFALSGGVFREFGTRKTKTSELCAKFTCDRPSWRKNSKLCGEEWNFSISFKFFFLSYQSWHIPALLDEINIPLLI